MPTPIPADAKPGTPCWFVWRGEVNRGVVADHTGTPVAYSLPIAVGIRTCWVPVGDVFAMPVETTPDPKRPETIFLGADVPHAKLVAARERLRTALATLVEFVDMSVDDLAAIDTLDIEEVVGIVAHRVTRLVREIERER